MVKQLLVCLVVCIAANVEGEDSLQEGYDAISRLRYDFISLETFAGRTDYLYSSQASSLTQTLTGATLSFLTYDKTTKSLEAHLTQYTETVNPNSTVIFTKVDDIKNILKTDGFPEKDIKGVTVNVECAVSDPNVCVLNYFFANISGEPFSSWSVWCTELGVPQVEIEKCKSMVKEDGIQWKDMQVVAK